MRSISRPWIPLVLALALLWAGSPAGAGEAGAAGLGEGLHLSAADLPVKAAPGDALGGLPDDARIRALVVPGTTVAGNPHSLRRIAPYPEVQTATVGALRDQLADGRLRSAVALADPKPLGVTSEGTGVVGAPPWQEAGYRGQGVKVGILDTGFSGYQAQLGVELPATVVARSFHRLGLSAGGDTHGVAVAEIVHDVAPDAALYLVNFDGAGFDAAVDFLIGEGVDVINMSAGWTVGPFDGTSEQAGAVNRALEADIVWVNAAGNYADRHYSATYVDVNDNGWAELSGTVEANGFVVPALTSFTVDMTWWDRAADLDLCVYDLTSTPPARVVCSSTTQWPGDLPVEFVSHTNNSVSDRRYGFAVSQCSGYYATRTCSSSDVPTRYDVFVDPALDLDFQVADYSLAVPADVEGVITVGAVAWDSPTVIEPYSSRGPTADGRIKPDLVAPSRVSTATFGGRQFAGTSSSAPHVSGLVALYLSAFPGTTPAVLRQALASLAEPPVPGGGKDVTFGWGLGRLGAPPGDHSWVGLQDPASGRWVLDLRDGSKPSFYFGDPGDIPLACDWNGDGIDTVGLYRPSEGFLYLSNANGRGVADLAVFYGAPEDLPVCGDWNGDGVDTIGVYRPSESRFYLRNSNTQGFSDVSFVFGNPGDRPFAGDWDGDGVDTVGVHRPAEGRVFVANRNVQGFAELAAYYGLPGDRFVVGDWDGDGRDTFGIFRPSDGSFYLSNLFGQSVATQTFSLPGPGSIPVAGLWAA